MTVALYPRVSGHEQEDNYSIPEQIKRMKAYCEARGWIVYKIYTDSGFSGSNLNRPGLQSLIKDLGSGKFEMVLVYKLDRLSRSQKDTLYLIEDVFDKHNVYFTSITENFDTSTPTGKAFLGILAVFAQFEREQIRERTMIGKESRAKEGKWHGSNWLPIGYDYKDDMLIQNEYEVMQIKEAVDLFLKRTPINTIAKILNKRGYRHNRGNGTWDYKTVKRVLMNPVYIGMMKHRDKYYEGIHEPIFDKKTYDDIMLIMNERKERNSSHHSNHTTLLGGLLYCKNCGAKYAKSTYKSGNVCYVCYSRSKRLTKMIKDANCKNKIYPTTELDQMIISAITNLSVDDKCIQQIRDKNPVNNFDEKIKAINSEIENLASQISNMLDLYSLGNMPLELINQKITALNDKKTALEKELDSIEVPSDTERERMTTEQIQNLASVINNNNLSLNDKRTVVQSLISYIEIDQEDVTIHWKF